VTIETNHYKRTCDIAIWNTFYDGEGNDGVTALDFDSDGKLWVGTWNGGVFSYDGEEVKHFTTDDGLSSNIITTLAVSANGDVWVGTYNSKICMYTGETWIIFDIINYTTIDKVMVNENGVVWFVTAGGIYCYNGESWISNVGVNGVYLTTLAFGPDNNVWAGSWNGGIYQYNGTQWQPIMGSPYKVSCISVDPDGKVWVGSSWNDNNHHGLFCYDGIKWTNYQLEDGPIYNEILSLKVDLHRQIWCGTTKGVSRFNGIDWTHYDKTNGLTDNPVNSIAMDSYGNLWLGLCKGVCCYNGNEWISLNNSENIMNECVIDLKLDSNNYIWAGTSDKGVSFYDGTSWTTYTKNDGLPSDYILSIAIDQDNNVWCGTYDYYYGDDYQYKYSTGVSYYNGDEWIQYNSMNAAQQFSSYVNAIAVDNQGIVWFGTESGAVRYDGISWTSFTTGDGLPSNEINTIAIGPDNSIWFGTEKGLTHFDSKTWTTYTTFDGLVYDSVLSLAFEKNDVLWVGTKYGLSRFEQQTTDAEMSGPSRLTILHNYPNPFNLSTTIQYSLPSENHVELTIYDILGRKIITLVNEDLPAGDHSIIWNGKNNNGIKVGSGIYLCKFKAGTFSEVGKVSLIK
jgi:ligand-binding sensor domain-containing protein